MDKPAAIYARVLSDQQKENHTIQEPDRSSDRVREDTRIRRAFPVAGRGV